MASRGFICVHCIVATVRAAAPSPRPPQSVIITCVHYLGPPGPFSFPDSRDLLEALGGPSSAERELGTLTCKTLQLHEHMHEELQLHTQLQLQIKFVNCVLAQVLCQVVLHCSTQLGAVSNYTAAGGSVARIDMKRSISATRLDSAARTTRSRRSRYGSSESATYSCDEPGSMPMTSAHVDDQDDASLGMFPGGPHVMRVEGMMAAMSLLSTSAHTAQATTEAATAATEAESSGVRPGVPMAAAPVTQTPWNTPRDDRWCHRCGDLLILRRNMDYFCESCAGAGYNQCPIQSRTVSSLSAIARTKPSSQPRSQGESADESADSSLMADDMEDSMDSDSGWGTATNPGPARTKADKAGQDRLLRRSATYESPLAKGWSDPPSPECCDHALQQEVERELAMWRSGAVATPRRAPMRPVDLDADQSDASAARDAHATPAARTRPQGATAHDHIAMLREAGDNRSRTTRRTRSPCQDRSHVSGSDDELASNRLDECSDRFTDRNGHDSDAYIDDYVDNDNLDKLFASDTDDDGDESGDEEGEEANEAGSESGGDHGDVHDMDTDTDLNIGVDVATPHVAVNAANASPNAIAITVPITVNVTVNVAPIVHNYVNTFNTYVAPQPPYYFTDSQPSSAWQVSRRGPTP